MMFIFSITDGNAQSRLTPISGAIYWGKNITEYEIELNRLLLPAYYTFAYVVKPSFSEEYCLAGTREDILILRKTKTQIYRSMNYDKSSKVSIDEYKLQIPHAVMDSIYKLIRSAVLSSSYLDARWGHDGTSFVFISSPYTAECWSPEKGSNCGKLVALADFICRAVEKNESELILSNTQVISELYHVFRSFYDEEPLDYYN